MGLVHLSTQKAASLELDATVVDGGIAARVRVHVAESTHEFEQGLERGFAHRYGVCHGECP